jgi:hypothetical protein
MNSQARQLKIEHYGNAYNILTNAIKRFPKEAWHFRSPDDPWTIHEIVVHITDSEANSFVRCRHFIAQPGEPILAYDENQWARALDYEGQSAEDALELFRWLRLMSYRLIKSLPESAWSNTVYHPENGVMTLDDWLDVYASHIPDHVEQMNRIYEAWLSQPATTQ